MTSPRLPFSALRQKQCHLSTKCSPYHCSLKLLSLAFVSRKLSSHVAHHDPIILTAHLLAEPAYSRGATLGSTQRSIRFLWIVSIRKSPIGPWDCVGASWLHGWLSFLALLISEQFPNKFLALIKREDVVPEESMCTHRHDATSASPFCWQSGRTAAIRGVKALCLAFLFSYHRYVLSPWCLGMFAGLHAKVCLTAIAGLVLLQQDPQLPRLLVQKAKEEWLQAVVSVIALCCSSKWY